MTIIDDNKKIIDQLSNVIFDQDKEREPKVFEEEFNQFLDELYSIATTMISFKNSGGKLYHDYGNGVLIEIFFKKLVADSFKHKVEPAVVERFNMLDLQNTLYEPFDTFEALKNECEIFLKAYPDAFHPSKFKAPGATSCEEMSNWQITSPNNSYKADIEQERVRKESSKGISHSKK